MCFALSNWDIRQFLARFLLHEINDQSFRVDFLVLVMHLLLEFLDVPLHLNLKFFFDPGFRFQIHHKRDPFLAIAYPNHEVGVCLADDVVCISDQQESIELIKSIKNHEVVTQETGRPRNIPTISRALRAIFV